VAEAEAAPPARMLVTHDGCLDGATAALVWTLAFPGAPVAYCEPSAVAQAAKDAVAQARPQELWLVDVSAPGEVLDSLGIPVRVLDHHESARHLAGRPGVTWDVGRCGSYLLWEELRRSAPALDAYAPLLTWVDDYDRWLKQTPVAGQLATLFSLLGRPWYLLRFSKPPDPEAPFSAEEQAILAHAAERGERRLRRGQEHAVTLTDPEGRRVRAAFADGDTSQLGHLLAEPEGVAYALLYNPATQAASLRGVGRVNLAHLAERLGGGGHPNAAGFTPPDPATLTRQFLSALLEQAMSRPAAPSGSQDGG
jgi:oligoribonuclease NrnB/cAMP/cGMP phosphodiesterase (DHH superfamily)